MIIDTSALLAFFDLDEPRHDEVGAIIEGSAEPLVVSPYVVAELDYLLATRRGVDAELAAMRELAGGAWDLPAMDAQDLTTSAGVISQYADQQIGMADASLVVLAERYSTRTVVTLDRRHFSVIRPLSGGRFAIRP